MILVSLGELWTSQTFVRSQVTGNKAFQGKSAEPDSVFKIITDVYFLESSDFRYESSS